MVQSKLQMVPLPGSFVEYNEKYTSLAITHLKKATLTSLSPEAKAYRYLGALYALKAIFTTFPPLSTPPLTHITTNLYIDNLGVVRRSQDTPSPSSNALSLIGISCTKHTKSEQLSPLLLESYMCIPPGQDNLHPNSLSSCQPTSKFLQIPGPTRHIRIALALTQHQYYPPLKQS
jgi:hypothetical protein